MYQNTFETLAIETTLTSRQAIPTDKWQEIGCFFIRSYLDQLEKAEKYLIGHIKGLIELADDGLIKLSTISQDQPVNCERHGSETNSIDGRLTFNAIVSGIEKSQQLKFFHLALARTCSVFELLTDYREVVHHAGHSHHQNQPCPVCNGHHDHPELSGNHHQEDSTR